MTLEPTPVNFTDVIAALLELRDKCVEHAEPVQAATLDAAVRKLREAHERGALTQEPTRLVPLAEVLACVDGQRTSLAGDDDAMELNRSDLIEWHNAALNLVVRALTARFAQPDPAPERPSEPAFDLVSHLERQRKWSLETFGPGLRTYGLLSHLLKELREVEDDPTDVTEWIDVVILAFDGAWRHGHDPAEIVAALVAKQTRNEGRTWPDWRQSSEDEPIEHVADQPQPTAAPEPLPRVPAYRLGRDAGFHAGVQAAREGIAVKIRASVDDMGECRCDNCQIMLADAREAENWQPDPAPKDGRPSELRAALIRTVAHEAELVDEVDNLRAAVAAVRELHYARIPFDRPPVPTCSSCGDQGGYGRLTPWPCPTIAALDAALGADQ